MSGLGVLHSNSASNAIHMFSSETVAAKVTGKLPKGRRYDFDMLCFKGRQVSQGLTSRAHMADCSGVEKIMEQPATRFP